MTSFVAFLTTSSFLITFTITYSLEFVSQSTRCKMKCGRYRKVIKPQRKSENDC